MICFSRGRFGAIRSLVLVTFFAIVLAAAAAPAQAATGAFSSTGSMNFARDGHTATLLPNGEVLVTGGWNPTNGYLASAELFDPAKGKWSLTRSMTAPRQNLEAVLLQNGQVLVAGGLNASGGTSAPPLSSAELYNPSTGTWTGTGSMTTGREDFVLTLLSNGKVLAAGGFNNGPLSSAELYDPATGSWSATGTMSGDAANNDAVLLQNGEVFVPDELYNPATGTWSATSSPPPGGGAGPIALLPNGNVFTAGNIQGGALYNPSTNQWTSFGPPPCTTINQNCDSAGALLQTGKVLVAGGITKVNAQPYPISETNGLAALFDPSSLTWASTGKMSKDRVGETMTVLQNGQALVAGGESYDKSAGALRPIASAELYTP